MPEEQDKKNNDEQPTEDKRPPVRKKKRKSFLTRFVQIIAFAFSLLILLIIAIIIFIQTDIFNKIALNFTLEKLNESWLNKESVITADSISGNILTGIELKHGSIQVKGDTMISYSSIHVEYDLWGLLQQDINLKKLIVSEPAFNLVEVKGKNDSLIWNVNYLFSSDEVDLDTTSSPFEWDVNLEHLELHNGTVKFFNRKDPSIPLSQIKFAKQEQFAASDLEISSLNMIMNAKYFLNQKEIHILDFNFNTNSDVYVKKMTLDAIIDESANTTSLTNFALESTRSNIYINTLSMENFNPFENIVYEAFKDNDVKIDLVTDKFSFDDLKFFFPDTDFLDSTVYLDLKAEGKYGNLMIKKLELKTPVSVYNFSGRLENLDKPENLIFDITGTNLEIDPSDTRILLPGVSIPDYSYLGKVSIPHITYKGEATRFNSEFDIRSTAGNANGNIFLDLNQPYLIYKGDVSTRNLNIGRIIKDKTLESNINADLTVDGRGTDFNTMDIKLTYDLTGSRFFGQNITKSGGFVNLNRGNAQLDVTYISSGVSAKVAGKVSNLNNINNLTYNLKGYSKNLDISAFTKDASQKSNLNFTFDINGRGTDPDNVTGKFDFDLNRSLFADFIIPATPLKARLEGGPSDRNIEVDSDIIEFKAKGQFSFTSLSNAITANINEITEEITKMMTREDTLSDSLDTYVSTPTGYPEEYKISTTESIKAAGDLNVNYSLKIKTLTPIASYTDTALILKADIKGSIRNSNNVFNMTAKANIDDLLYGDSMLVFHKGIADLNVSNNASSPGLEGFNSYFTFYTDSVMIQKNKFDSLNLALNFRDYSNNYRLSTKKDSTFIVSTNGMFDFYKEKIRVSFDSLRFNYANYDVRNNGDLLVSYIQKEGEEGIDFEKFKLSSGNQRIDIDGKFSLNDTTSDLKVSADNISLAELQRFNDPTIKDDELITGGLRRVELVFKGSMQDPNIYAEVNSDPLIVSELPIGRVDAVIDYNDNNLKPDISFYNTNNEGNLKITGNIPIQNPLGSIDSTVKLDSVALGNEEVDLNLAANNFQFALLSQFVPSISDLQGNLNGNLKITGIASQPLLNGGLTLKNTNFTLDMTNMYYAFEANLKTEGQRLILDHSKLYDPDEDTRFITTTGYIDFTDLTLNDIQLNMTGDVRVFDRNDDPTAFGVYGDLIAGSGTPNLKLSGNSQRLDLTGNLILKSGNVIINPVSNQTYNIFDDDFVYTMTIDSTNMSDSMISALNNQIKELKERDYNTLNPFEKILVPENAIRDTNITEPSLFVYDLHITSEKDIYLRFIVNERTKQEFFGSVNADLYVDNNTENQMSAYGTVELGDDAYYRFYKRFDASGTLEFTGEIGNPKLNVNAEYISRSVSQNAPEADEYKVILKVLGSAQKPDLSFSVQKNGVPIGGSDPTSDAMSLILFGRPMDGGTQGNVITSIGVNVGSIFVSDYVSNIVQDVLPFIVNTDLNYVDTRSGSIAENTDLTLTAEFGDAIVRVGGQVFGGIANTNIIIQYPLARLLGLKNIGNNLVLQLERVTDQFTGTNLERDVRDTRTGGLIYYRIKF